MKKLIIAIILTISASQAFALVPERDWIERKAEGWFWYNEEVEEEIEEPKEELTITPPPIPAPMPEEQKPLSYDEEAKQKIGSVAWVRANLPRYLDMAIDNPTDENVEAYLLLQRYLSDKSSEFAKKVTLVTLGNPELDEISNGPTAQGASGVSKTQAKENLIKVRNRLMSNSFLLFIVDNSAQSNYQARIMDKYRQLTGFKIIVAKQIKEKIDNPYGYDWLDDSNVITAPRIDQLAEIRTIPAIFLIDKDKNFHPIVQGTIVADELDYRIINIAYRDKLISEDEFFSIAHSTIMQNSITKKVDFTLGSQTELLDQDEKLVAPTDVIDFFKKNRK